MEKERQYFHLNTIEVTIEPDKVEAIKFQNSEFENFILALVPDLI